jgi:hypothetical protein
VARSGPSLQVPQLGFGAGQPDPFGTSSGTPWFQRVDGVGQPVEVCGDLGTVDRRADREDGHRHGRQEREQVLQQWPVQVGAAARTLVGDRVDHQPHRPPMGQLSQRPARLTGPQGDRARPGREAEAVARGVGLGAAGEHRGRPVRPRTEPTARDGAAGRVRHGQRWEHPGPAGLDRPVGLIGHQPGYLDQTVGEKPALLWNDHGFNGRVAVSGEPGIRVSQLANVTVR